MNTMFKIILIGTAASSTLGFRSDLIKLLQQNSYKVYVFSSEYTLKELKTIESLGAIPMTYKINRSGLNPIADIKSTLVLAKEIRKIKPDLVFSYFSKPVIFGTLAAKLARVPRVIGMLEGLGYTFTEQPREISKKTQFIKKAQIILYKLALPQLDKLIFLNPDDPKDLLEKYNITVKQTEILGGIGLNLADYKHSNNYPKDVTFIFVARLLAEKGIHDYIAAAKIVRESYSNTKFIVLGAVDEEARGALTDSELEQFVDNKTIEYPGHVNNVSDWVAKSSVFVLPSYYREGVPRSIQEAMAVGRAVITTDVPGCRETVVDGVNGFLVEKWNLQVLAEKMIYFIENPEQVAIMGHESHKMAQEKFDANEVNKRLLAILEL